MRGTELQTAAETHDRAGELLNSPGWGWFCMRMKERQDAIMEKIFADNDALDDLEAMRANVLRWRVIQEAVTFPQTALDQAVRKGNEAGRDDGGATNF
jgi:hypothetical protein